MVVLESDGSTKIKQRTDGNLLSNNFTKTVAATDKKSDNEAIFIRHFLMKLDLLNLVVVGCFTTINLLTAKNIKPWTFSN